MEHETFWTLLTDLAHWEFELFLIFIFDVLIGLVAWPYLKKFIRHHKGDDDQIECLQRQVADLQARFGIKDEGCDHEACKEKSNYK
jgi:hypothetical protein